ncbi:hypothetical protein [Sphingomonas sp. R86521]|uniref:hypothetical protein n=1 Tax=Sphingomonas sp. R86521 TaxID=3093860 RepID=UPI0036D2C3F5
MIIYLILFALYVLAPKIDLYAIGSAAIRPEDIINAVAFLVYVVSSRRPFSVPGYAKFYLLFIGFGLIAAVINLGQGGLVGLVYGIRLAQYMTWFFILYEAAPHLSARSLRWTCLIVCGCFVIWGFGEYTSIIPRIGKFSGATQRLTINTSGPFETSAMLAMLAYAAPAFWLTPFMIVIIFLTQARITLLGILVSFAAARPGRTMALGFAGALVATVAAQPIYTAISASRLGASETPLAMGGLLAYTWKRVPVVPRPAYYRERFLQGSQIFRYMPNTRGDLSFKYRAVRWPIIIKSTAARWIQLFVGWGPGAWSNAVDGYYVRIFGETGLIGVALFVACLVAALRTLQQRSIGKFSLVMLIIAGFFIDIFASSKVMPILWVFLALEHAGHPFAFRRARPLFRLRPRQLPTPRSAPVQPA